MKHSARVISGNVLPISSGTDRPFVRVLGTAVLAVFLGVFGAVRASTGATFDQATLAASKSLETKLQILQSKDTTPSATYPPVIITENEANSYLKVHSSEHLPAGVGSPSLGVQPEHATASADVNFDELSRTYPNPNDMAPKILAAMFHGTQRVTVVAKVQSESAGVRVQIESVVVGSITVPNWLVDYLIQNVLQPRYQFDLSKPLPYPDHVTLIVLGSGQVICVRGNKTSQQAESIGSK